MRRRRRSRRLRVNLHRLVLTVVLVYALALGLRQQVYLARLERDIRATRAELDEARARRAALEAAIRRLQDPAVVELEARRRLGLARPGEIQYVTVPAAGAPAGAEDGAPQR